MSGNPKRAAGSRSAEAARKTVAARKKGASAAARASRRKMFFRSSAVDFVLVLVVSVALVRTVSFGFNSGGASLQGNYALIAAVDAVLLAVLFAGSWSKRALVPTAIATAVLAVAVVGAGAALSPDVLFLPSGELNDVEGNAFAFCIILAAAPIAAFLLSRRPVGLVVLAALAVFCCALIQYLYRDWLADGDGAAIAVVMTLALVALFVFQNYRQSVYQAARAKDPKFFGALGFSVAIGAVCVLLGAAVFYGIVQHTGLTTPDWRPFIHEVAAPVQYYRGEYEEQQVQGDETTSDTNDRENETQNDAEEGSLDESGQAGQSGRFHNLMGSVATTMMGYSETEWEQNYTSISYQILSLFGLIVALSIILLAVAAVLARRWLRTRRLKRLEGRPLPYRVWSLYGFFVERFRRLKMAREPSQTPREFAVSLEKDLAPFTEAAGVSFTEVTEVYERACLGACPVDEGQYERVVRYYRSFFKSARMKTGPVKWLWKFWRI